MSNEETKTMFVVNTWFHYFAVEGNFDKNDFEGCMFFESESEMFAYLICNSYYTNFDNNLICSDTTFKIVKNHNGYGFEMIDDAGDVRDIKTTVPKFISEFCL